MKEYKIKIDANKEQITAPYIELVVKDYNSTALVFECNNVENYMMIFQLLRPDGTVWRKEIRDNKVVLGEENENGEIVPVITINGDYWFDVAFYDGNSKITTTKQERLFARAEIPQENISELPPKNVLDDLIEDVQGALTQTDNLNVAVEKVDKITTINVTHKDGSIATVQVLDGEKGDKGDVGPAGAIKMMFLNERPETGSEDTLYFIKKVEPETDNMYDEYAWVNKGTEDEPSWDWEYLGSPKVEIELAGYVKDTDYATSTKAGVIKADIKKGISVDNNGYATIYQASVYDIDKKTNLYAPITPYRQDYAWKVSATTNTAEWTDEEKTQACNLIAAVRQVEYSQTSTLPSGSDGGFYGRAYVRDKTNQENSIPLCSQNRNYTLPIRDHNGNFYVGNPTIAYHCANKAYVDGLHITLTQAEYDALTTKDANTYYYIVEE